MTSLGFVITPIAAHFILREQVTGLRWLGILLIVGGAGVISWSEQAKPKPPVPAPALQTTAAIAPEKPVV
jgi:drug/metabolite transporter (DMT)-like permease